MTTTPFDPFHRIRDAVKDAIEPLGVKFMTWNVATGDDEGDKPYCTILMVIDPSAFLSDDQKRVREQLAEIEAAELEIDNAKRAREASQAAKDDLLQISRRGIFDEDVAPEE